MANGSPWVMPSHEKSVLPSINSSALSLCVHVDEDVCNGDLEHCVEQHHGLAG